MSGIAGIIHFDGRSVERGLIEKMTGAMAHRGPDGINHWVRGSVALGQCMLRTTPESLEEHQPLTNEDETLVLVMDGRVDNWEELRRELLGRGVVLRNRADAELVLRAYETWGPDCLAHTDGDFALVIWDARRQQVFCARDRIGNKPFNYYWDGKTLAFASDLHTILALPWVPETLNEGMVAELLAAEFYSRDETFWQGILRLAAAHRMVVSAGGPRLEKYWEPDLWATFPYTKEEEYIESYRDLFTDVVRRLSRSFRPVACEVSGGLDSSAVFAVAVNLARQFKLPAPGIQAYTLDFHDDPDANELEFSRAVGRHLGQQIEEIAPTQMPLSWYRNWAHSYREFPGYPNGVMGLGIRKEAASKGTRALLVGVGGDQWVGGSRNYYTEALLAGEWSEFFSCMRSDWKDCGLRAGLWWPVRYGFAPLLPHGAKQVLRKMLAGDQMRAVGGRSWLAPAMTTVIQERYEKDRSAPIPRTRRYGQRESYRKLLQAYDVFAQELEERLCSSEGLELRRPFQNPRVIQFAFTVPAKLRFRGNINKFIHRKAMDGVLPTSVLSRQTKAEFSVTLDRYLPEMKTDLVDLIPARNREWLRSSEVRSFYERYVDRGEAELPGWMLWNLFGCDAVSAMH